MNYLVSVIMPSYNTANFIKDSINSVLCQTYKNFELIIIDDCSNDDTEKIIASYHDNRIKFIKLSKNSGAAIARNKALKEANGKWIAFLDSDDIWYPNKLEKQIAFMVSNNYVFSYTNYIEIDETSNPNGRFVTGPKHITQKGMFNYCWPGCLTVMYDAERIGLIQIEDIKKNNDYAMWLKICKKADCYLLDEVLAKYRRGRKGSVCSQSYFTMIKWHYLLFKNAEKKNVITSIVFTFNNLIFGCIKKIIYCRTVKKEG